MDSQIDRDTLLAQLRQSTGGVRSEELNLRGVPASKKKHRIARLLTELLREGAISKRGGRYYVSNGEKSSPTKKIDAAVNELATGTLRVHPSGFGFVEMDRGGDDTFIPQRSMAGALDRDRVAVTAWPSAKGPEGRIDRIVEPGRKRVTGTIHRRGKRAVVEPDDPRIQATISSITIADWPSLAKEGQVVVVELDRDIATHAVSQGRVSQILGDVNLPQTEIEKILINHDIPAEFPAEVLAQVAGSTMPAVAAVEPDRVDLRHLNFLTIDPENARDFDDAVCVEAGPGGKQRLWVAVADVSYFVVDNTALDEEARGRGCSVYLPDRAIPMLPEKLSGDLCSLRPLEDRLAMVVRQDIDSSGQAHEPYFAKAVIRSKARLDYGGVARVLDHPENASPLYQPWLPMLGELETLAQKLRRRRLADGAFDFDLPEAKVILDEDDPNRIRDIRMSRSDPAVKRAYSMIEDFMIAANVGVAKLFHRHTLDTLWRIHEAPTDEKLELLAEISETLGLSFTWGPEENRATALQRLIQKVHGKPFAEPVTALLLRAMKQAVYSVKNVGHFGLAEPYYLHFTSPIRRYPDLVVHRLLKQFLAGQLSGRSTEKISEDRLALENVAKQNSASERNAMQVEWEAIDVYRAFFLRDRIGDVFDGNVSSVTSFGLFVRVAEPFFEGLIRLDGLHDDFYLFDEKTLTLRGRRTGRRIQLGDPLRVKIENVSVSRRQIDLVLEETENDRASKSGDRNSLKKFISARKKARPQTKRPPKPTARPRKKRH